MSALRLVLFDLDGTLADTAPDIARAINRVLAESGRPPLPLARVREIVSSGARALLRAGFGDATLEEEELERLLQRLFVHYAARPAQATTVFAGLRELIGELAGHGVGWSVVTNKPERLARPIVGALELAPPPGCVIGGDTLAARKPEALPLVTACRRAGVEAAQAIYVGDAEIDVRAARAAGMPVAVAGFGYAPAAATVRAWEPDLIAADVAALRDYLLGRIATAA